MTNGSQLDALVASSLQASFQCEAVPLSCLAAVASHANPRTQIDRDH